MDPLSAIGLGIATNMATNLLRAAYRDFVSAAFGPPEQRELQKVFSHASERFVGVLFRELESSQAESLRDVFDQFISNPKVANALVGIAFAGSETQIPYEVVQEAFHEAGFDPSTLPLNFDAALATYVEALSSALDTHAMRSDSPINNWVVTGKLRAAQDIRANNSELLQVIVQRQTEFKGTLGEVQEGVHRIENVLSEQSKTSSKMNDYIQVPVRPPSFQGLSRKWLGLLLFR